MCKVNIWSQPEVSMTMNVSTDLQSLFTWNTKQVFVFLAAKYETPKNSLNQEKYQQRREEILQSASGEGTSAEASPPTSVNDNEIYLDVVGGQNYKGNVYGLGTLRKRFSRSKSSQATEVPLPMAKQMEEMYDTIKRLNDELVAKAEKEKTPEEKMTQLMEVHSKQTQQMQQQMPEQNEQIRQQHQQMQLILQHLQIKPVDPTLPTVADDTDQNVEHHEVDGVHHTVKDP